MSHGDAAAEAYVTALAAAGVSGLVVELGGYVPALSPWVAATADALGLPLIALHRVTRFVEITEAVHRVIVAEKYAELEFARTVHETFTELSVRRAALAEIVQTAANMLDAAVVLEDLAHRVLALTARHASTSALLENWENTSRLLPDDWDAVAIGPHTQRWGRLLLRSEGVPSARARMVLERAAQTLTLHRMIEKDRFGLHRQAQTGLIDDMVNGKLDERDARTRAAALGVGRPDRLRSARRRCRRGGRGRSGRRTAPRGRHPGRGSTRTRPGEDDRARRCRPRGPNRHDPRAAAER